MRAAEATLAAIDFETTGQVGLHPSEPWQVGVVSIRSGITDASSQWMRYLRVGERPFSRYAPGAWMQHLDEIARAPDLPHVWPELKRLLSVDALIGHNIGTERSLLAKAAPLHRPGPWIDTLKLCRIAFPEWSSHALGDVLDRLDLLPRTHAMCPGRHVHDALFDAVGTALLFCHLLQLPGWSDLTVSDLVGARPVSYHQHRRRG